MQLAFISLRDDPHAIARTLVESGCFPSLSAVVQKGLDVLRQQDADAQADRSAPRALLQEGAQGPFPAAHDMRARLAARRR